MHGLLRVLARIAAAVARCSRWRPRPAPWPGARRGHRMIGEAAALVAAAGAAGLPAHAPRRRGPRRDGPRAGPLEGRGQDPRRQPRSGHFVDVDDDGRVLGGPALDALPPTREEYDAALRAVGSDSFSAGYLPYSIIDGWQQLAKDFAYWRVLTAAIPREHDPATADLDAARPGAARASDPRRSRRLVALCRRRQPADARLGPLQRLGRLSRTRATSPRSGCTCPSKGLFVRQFVGLAAVRAAMPPPQACAAIEACTADYLAAPPRSVVPFYEMQKAGGMNGARPGRARLRRRAGRRRRRGAARPDRRRVGGQRRRLDRLSARSPSTRWSTAASIPSTRSMARTRWPSPCASARREPGLDYRERPAAYGLLERDGRLALVHVSLEDRPPFFDLPGGGIDAGEDEAAALVREFGEETGLVVVGGRADHPRRAVYDQRRRRALPQPGRLLRSAHCRRSIRS